VQIDSTCSGLNSCPCYYTRVPGPQCRPEYLSANRCPSCCPRVPGPHGKQTAPAAASTVVHAITPVCEGPRADRQHLQWPEQLPTLLPPYARAPLQADSTSSSITVAHAIALACQCPVQADSNGGGLDSCPHHCPMCQGPSAGRQHLQ
jgi:hypothetical protein